MQRETLNCTSSTQQLVLPGSPFTRCVINVGQVHSNVPKKHHSSKLCSWSPQSQSVQFVSNFRVQSSEFLPPVVPDYRRHFNQGGEEKSRKLCRPQTDDSFCQPNPLLTLAELFVAVPSVRVLIHRSHVKISAVNFGRGVVVSLVPPYFHKQGGLQKNVGGATCDVACVRGLVQRNRSKGFIMLGVQEDITPPTPLRRHIQGA
ncbi:hypothetical protein ABVT39_007212 [Epinephelus coioides]